jgi:hypothetical protein
MPFIAIAFVIALALGGGVTVAADGAKPGDALYSYKVNVNDSVRHEYRAIKASLSGKVEAEDNTEVSGEVAGKRGSRDSDDTSTTTLSDYPEDNGGLRIRADADAEAKALDDKINADGSVEVNTR